MKKVKYYQLVTMTTKIYLSKQEAIDAIKEYDKLVEKLTNEFGIQIFQLNEDCQRSEIWKELKYYGEDGQIYIHLAFNI